METKVKTKICSKCKEEKSLDDFHNCKRNKDGKKRRCKSCRSQKKIIKRICPMCKKEFSTFGISKKYCSDKCSQQAKIYFDKVYYKNNKEYILDRIKENYKLIRGTILEYQKAYYDVNKNKKLEYAKVYRESNSEKVSEAKRKARLKKLDIYLAKSKKAYQKNRKKYIQYGIEYEKRRIKKDVNYKLSRRLRGRIRIALKSNSKSASTIKLLGCSIEEFKQHLEELFQEGMTWENYGNWHIDHILPCSAFELQNSEEQEICFHYTNLQPLWQEENLIKSNKITI